MARAHVTHAHSLEHETFRLERICPTHYPYGNNKRARCGKLKSRGLSQTCGWTVSSKDTSSSVFRALAQRLYDYYLPSKDTSS